MSFVLALDQGTTSSRALVFDHAGTVRAVAQQEFRQIFPQPGWVEHDAGEIWATQSGVMHEALARAGIGARDLVAIGITNQRETTVLWDRATGRAVAHAIVWQDRRTAPHCDALRAAGHAGMPRGVGMPNLRKISLPWYSWIFTRAPWRQIRLFRASDASSGIGRAGERGYRRRRGLSLQWRPRDRILRRGGRARQPGAGADPDRSRGLSCRSCLP